MDKVCRTCLKVSRNLIDLFDDSELPHKIQTIASIEVCRSNNLPSKICSPCVRNVHLLYDFRSVIIRSNIILKGPSSTVESKAQNNICDEENDLQIKSEHAHWQEETFTEEILDTKSEIAADIDNVAAAASDNTLKCTEVEDLNGLLEENKYSCISCEFSCTHYLEWRRHKQKHHSCPKSVCSVCGKLVRTDNLTKHMYIHVEAPVTCKSCGKVCKNSESLRSHNIIHRNNNLRCNVCGNVYRHRGGLAAHVKRHDPQYVKPKACSLCNKSFFEKNSLDKHMRSHTGERPYLCEFCKKGFSSSNALKTHRRQHTNEKPYACTICPMAFPQRVSLRTHLKSKHPEAPALSST